MSEPEAQSSGSANLAPETTFKDGAKEYTLTPPDLGTETFYVQYLETGAIAGVRRNRAAWGEDYPKAMERVAAQVGLRQFEWGGQLWLESLYTTAGIQELAYLCLRQGAPGLTREVFDRLWKANVYVRAEGRANKIAEAVMTFLNRPNSTAPDGAASA